MHSGILLYCNMKSYYSRIPLIQHTRGQTGARFLDIVDYWTVPVLTYVPVYLFVTAAILGLIVMRECFAPLT